MAEKASAGLEYASMERKQLACSRKGVWVQTALFCSAKKRWRKTPRL